MTIQEIKKYIKLHKIKYKTISDNSGIPLGTLRNIFSNAKIDPRASTVEKIEQALEIDKSASFAYKYFTVEEEALIATYRTLSARDKNLIVKIIKEISSNTRTD